MKCNELIEVNPGFQASVNLEYDLNKIEKIRGYIPTEQSVKVLGDFLHAFYYNTEPQNRATVLIGPYGRGKSHLFLVLSALTSLDMGTKNAAEKENARETLIELCGKIACVNHEVGALARAIVDSNTRTLPVIINSNSTDINQAFLVALNDALTRAGLETLLPDTHFDSAVAILDKWESGFPDAIAKLKGELRRRKGSLEDLRIGLRQFNQNAYRLFCDCYPKVAAGTVFNPLTNMDVVKLYMAVSNALMEQTGYCGISIIFDEFSKFLEINLDKSKMLNFKIIQDMAEAATRSREAQLHFTCITHKDILDYSSSDSFKTVEGRFRKVRFVASSEQSYELIANAIIKKDAFAAFREAHAERFTEMANRSAMTTVFSDLSPETYESKLISGCFPMSPLSAFALLHASELVGQNERTLFTFLAQSDRFTFRAFIDAEMTTLKWITVDYVYDYFEELFKKEVFNTSVHSVWAKTNSAVRQVTDAQQLRILKAIAIIHIIGDERLRAVPAHIKAALLLADEDFETAVKGLLKRHIISQRDSSEYVLLTANGVDVQRSVDQYIKTSLAKINICESLSLACDLGFVIPREYNDKFGMLRSFKNIYMEASVFLSYADANQLLADYPYDGLVVYLVCIDDELLNRVYEKIQTFSGASQIVICMTKHPFSCEGLLKQYEAARRLLVGNADSHFVEELEVLSEDLQKRIQSAVYTMYAPSSEHSVFYTGEGPLDISRQVELNHAISTICNKCYCLTPIVNNEMVNKLTPNSQNKKARDTVVTWILRHAEDNTIPCMDGFGPEVSIFKSAFKHTGLDVSSTVADAGMNRVLEMLGAFIDSSEKKKKNFQLIYQKLTSSPYGMRKGVIPLYIAYALRPYMESVVLYFRGREIELSAATLSGLNDNPESYEILIEAGTSEKNKYLDDLQQLFEKHEDTRTPSINRVYSIVKSMQNWMRSLPEFTKKFKYCLENGAQKAIPTGVDVIRSELMRFEINSRELLLGTWPERLSANGDVMVCLSVIRETKDILDRHLSLYQAEMIKKLTAMFIPGYQGGLAKSMMIWHEKLPDYTKVHVFDSATNALMTMAGTINSYDDEALLNSLVSSLVSIAIEDWNDHLAETFIQNAAEAIGQINDYTESGKRDGQDGRLLISIDGVQIEKTFAAETISPLGKTAFNNLKSVFEEYNEALEPDEQLAILAKLIGEIVK